MFWTRIALCELLALKNPFLVLSTLPGAHAHDFSLRLHLPLQEHTPSHYTSRSFHLTKTGCLVLDLQASKVQGRWSRCGIDHGFHHDPWDIPSDQRLDLLSNLLCTDGLDHNSLRLGLLRLSGWLLVLGLYFAWGRVWEKYLFLLNYARAECLFNGTPICWSLCKSDILQRLRLCFNNILHVYWHALVQLCIQQFWRARLTKRWCKIICLTRKHVSIDNSTLCSEFLHQ